MNTLQQYTTTWVNLTHTLLNKSADTKSISYIVLIMESSKTCRTNSWCLKSGKMLSLGRKEYYIDFIFLIFFILGALAFKAPIPERLPLLGLANS